MFALAYMGRKKTGRSPSQRFCSVGEGCWREQELSCMEEMHWKNIVFGPCTLGRTWGTRPEP
jgi:hypothetical protein